MVVRYPIVSVIATAGAGKTTAVRQAASLVERPPDDGRDDEHERDKRRQNRVADVCWAAADRARRPMLP